MFRTFITFISETTVVIAIFLCCQSAHAVDLIDQRIKVSGIWKDDSLIVYKLKYRDSRKDPASGRISGKISALDRSKKSFKLGPYVINWNQNTQFQQLTLSDLTMKKHVKVILQINSENQIQAIQIKPVANGEGSDTLQILGTISSIQKQNNGNILATLLGKTIVIPSQQISPAFVLTRKQDDRRPDDQLTTQIFGKQLTIGGEIGISPRFRHNFNLQDNNDRDRVRLDTEAQLELFYPWNTNLAFFVEGQVNYEQDLYRANKGTLKGEEEFKRGETWIFWGDILQSGFSLQTGRQNFRENREWWWDDDLDAIRLYYNQPFFHFELGLAEQAFSISTLDNGIPAEDQDVFRILSRISWTWASKQQLGLFFLQQYDHSTQQTIGQFVSDDSSDPVDGTYTWLGLRTQNKFSTADYGEFDFWTDLGWITGKEHEIKLNDSEIEDFLVVESHNKQNIEGWALDAGLTWEAPVSLNPTLTLGYAIGTSEYRQTGLQDNNDRFRAVSRFRYYGELLRPELSNLQIWTLGSTLPILENSSVSVLYHYYRQVDAQPFLRKGRINADPNGISPSIGHEWDLVIAVEEWKHWELEFITAVFKAGQAYGENSGNIAVNVEFKLNYNF